MSDQEVVEANALGKTTRASNLDAVGVPLGVNGTKSRVVAVYQCIGNRFAERGKRAIREDDPHHPDHKLLLAIARTKADEQLVHDAQKRPAEKVVSFDALTGERLQGNLVGRDEPAESLLAPEEEEEPEHAHR